MKLAEGGFFQDLTSNSKGKPLKTDVKNLQKKLACGAIFSCVILIKGLFQVSTLSAPQAENFALTDPCISREGTNTNDCLARSFGGDVNPKTFMGCHSMYLSIVSPVSEETPNHWEF